MAASTAAGLGSVQQVTSRLSALLKLARQVKSETTVEPALPPSPLVSAIDALHENIGRHDDQTYRFGVTEAASRQIFYSRIESTTIDSPDFVEVWDLLDILLICGDRGSCTPELVCWLIEELLDSQTTVGCRTVFDYLESRRERLAAKDFHKKNLVFLRSCNELLRRLSRAEDAIFCGRVFFFLFQTFPLGDKSSVNLRGEFHTENVTKYETDTEASAADDKMEIDTSRPESTPANPRAGSKDSRAGHKLVKKAVEEEALSNSALYPVFWRLQQDFCEPVRLFVPENFAEFKKGLMQTIKKFKSTPTVPQSHAIENGKRGVKRTASDDLDTSDGEAKDHFADKYNPKYLTSRKLFDLEVSDLAFQRHIMVQALILIDYLLSLTEKAKRKLNSVQPVNKSMLYAFTLDEDNVSWATTTRSTISNYLQSVGDGRFYCRMVETVLTRDKNWVRWKVEGCPSIVRDPVSTEEQLAARKEAVKATRPRRLPAQPLGAMDLSFLEEGSGGGLESLKDPSRFTPATIDELIRGIKTDELDLDFAVGDEEKEIRARLDNKKWRIVRQLRASRLAVLDKLEPGKDIEAVLRPKEPEETEPTVAEGEGQSGETGQESSSTLEKDVHVDSAIPTDQGPAIQNGSTTIQDLGKEANGMNIQTTGDAGLESPVAAEADDPVD